MPQVEAMYPLAPQQRGMFAGAMAATGEGEYIDQFVFSLHGKVDPRRLEEAWRTTVRRNAALRTAFVLAGRADPVQVVIADPSLSFEELDWRTLPEDRQTQALDNLLATDRARGFDLTRPPLTRVTLVRLAEDRTRMLWTVHHLVTDGWCMPVVVQQVLAAYDTGADPGPAPSYRDYVSYVRRRPEDESRAFWTRALEGFGAPTALGPHRTAPETGTAPEERYGERSHAVSAEKFGLLQKLAAKHRVTVGAVIEGAWATLLAAYSGSDDVVFGVTVSGRPPELPGVGTMVGPFAGLLPLRVPVSGELPVAAWLRGIQESTVTAQPHEHCAPGQIHQWLGRAGSQPLFHTALTFENYPVDPAGVTADGFRIDPEDLDFVAARSGIPLSLLVIPGDGLALRAVYDSRRLIGEDVTRVLDHLVDVLENFTDLVDGDVAALLARVPAGQAPRMLAPAHTGGEYRAPRNDTEAAVCEVFAEVLGVERIGIDDSFLDLGGHSLIATQIASRLRERFDTEIPLRALFDTPTVARLAATLTAPDATGRETVAVVPRGPGAVTPASAAQRRLWFLEQLHHDIPFHNMPAGFRLTGDLDTVVLERAFNEVIRRHEALRTVFEATDDGLTQVIRPELTVPLVPEQTDVPAAEWEAHLHQGAIDLAATPFDLARGPLIRARLLRRAPGEHALLVAVHHIVFDSWSRGVFLRELSALYEAGTRSEPMELPPVPLQFGDLAVWQEQWRDSPEAEAQIAYWRDRLTDTPVLDLFSDHVRPALPTFRGGSRHIDVPAELLARLGELGQSENASVFMVLLAAFDVILHRYTRQNDIVVGTPVANRNRHEFESVVGFLLNSVLMRVALDGDPSFRELLGRTRDAALGAYDHQDISFERLVEILQPTRDLAYNPLFQATFAVQQLPPRHSTLGAVEMDILSFDSGTTRFDIECNFYEDDDEGMTGVLTYATDLFDEGTIEALCRQYLKVLTQAVQDPDRPLSQLLPLEPDDFRRTVVEPNDTAYPLPQGATLTALFEAQAERVPDAVAVVTHAERLTFRELNERANRLARHLTALGVGQETPVGLHCPRSTDMIVGLLAILKTGGYCLPLDTAYPEQRLTFMMEDAGTQVVIGSGDHLRLLSRTGAQLVALDEDLARWADLPAGNLPPVGGPLSLAIIDYTSGSTGVPKGAGILHENIVRLLHGCRDLTVDEDIVTLQLASIAFDVAMFEIWGPLLHGGRLVMWEGGVPTAEDIRRAVTDQGVRTVILTATLFNTVVDQDVSGLAGLDQLIVCGERPSVPHIRRALAALPDTAVFNGYGPTECTTFTHYYPIPRDFPESKRNIPLGLPIVNTTTYVLDEELNPLPVGMPGEIYVGGEGLARGYLNRPRQTADRFVPDPFESAPGARLYRTGDLGRWLPAGGLEFLGRVDTQVKIRGHRVEPGEVEKVLVEHPAVARAAVVARAGRDGTNTLAAYLVPAAESALADTTEQDEHRKADTWRSVYDEIYGGTAAPDRFHAAGWNSSYTGRRLPEEQMRAWVTDTVDRIRTLNPRRVLEIGCGTGLLLFELLDGVKKYVATDFSESALNHIRGHLPEDAPVTLLNRFAHDLSGLPEGDFDVVVINSVLQYFPSAGYAERVLTGALGKVAPGGFLFVGDVRQQALQEAFHASVLLSRTDPAAQGGPEPARLRGELARQLVQDDELALHPAYFADLGHRLGTGPVELLLKQGTADTEMSRYRYDVVIHRDPAPAGPEPHEVAAAGLPDLDDVLARAAESRSEERR
ncbi:amino acid adenylation domain-containing protein, partial [Streptomyces sp. W16]|uniref:non-ribosomal peptide synthetase n=1 Tax=Streptomyces sp. W16 TaxID=3076631 RepID=UPI00295C0A77